MGPPRVAVLWLAILASCGGGYEIRDVNDYTADDYSRRLEDSSYRPERPRRRRPATDDAVIPRYELLYRRATLYEREAAAHGRGPLKLALTDMDECLRLAGENLRTAAFYLRRASIRMSLELEAGTHWNDYDSELKHELLSTLSREALQSAVADFAQALHVAKTWDDRAETFEGRGYLYYALGENELAAADALLLVKVHEHQREARNGIRLHAWEKLERIYGELKADAARAGRKDREEYFAGLEHRAGAEAGVWRAALKEQTRQLGEENRRAAEAKKAADTAARRAALDKATANRQTCSTCKGTGQVTTYDPGTAHAWKATDQGKGVVKWTFEGGRDSKWGQGSCPACYGRGFILPGIDD